LEKYAILGVEPGEFDPHALAGCNVANDSFGLNFTTWDFEGQFEFCAYWWGARHRDENAPKLRVPTREIWCCAAPYQATHMPLGKAMRW
jgi:hypothetical protein